MQTVSDARSTEMRPGSIQAGASSFLRRWLTGRRGLIVAAIALAGGGLALGWNWLVAVGAAPLILSLAPCAAMCALGICAMHKVAKSSSTDSPATAATQNPPKDDRQLELKV